ncbi:DUF5681 domain-containing protein [Rhizobium sp. HT1-10]|uniref:DUF5681 domain-containing protein n=1 Tax=Rhizobium sp. HT1-10 TaxID=3111638 RepID=UPI003C192726
MSKLDKNRKLSSSIVTVSTERQQRGLTPWKPGQSGNPAGRARGARNKLGEAFLEAMFADFEANGVAAIVKVRTEKPDQYLKVVASILPRDLNVNVNNLDDMSDGELLNRIRQLDAAIRPLIDGGERDAGLKH